MAKSKDVLGQFGNRVREQRKALGLSQEAFADVAPAHNPPYVAAMRMLARRFPLLEVDVLPNLRTKDSVIEFARQIGVHPGIVVGRLQHDGLIEMSWMNQLKQSLSFTAETGV